MQLLFEGFDLSSGFNCDTCKDTGRVKASPNEGFHACNCALGQAISCDDCLIEVSPFEGSDCFFFCACCGEEYYDYTPEQVFLIKEIDESWDGV